MAIQDQFNLIADEYDRDRRKFIPCFDEFYGGATDFIAASIPAPKRVIDLGAGTGILSAFWHKHFPGATFLLVDVAEEMLAVAKKRFSGAANVEFAARDYTRDFPFGGEAATRPDAVISALSIHHLADAGKKALFAKIYAALPRGGLFANYDQFCAGDETMDRWLSDYWESQILASGLAPDALEKWRGRRKLDRECSVTGEIQMLKASGFESAACVFQSQKFAVLVGLKLVD